MNENLDLKKDFEDFLDSLDNRTEEEEISPNSDNLELEELETNDLHARLTAQIDYEEWQWQKELKRARVERETAIRQGKIDRDASNYFYGATEDNLGDPEFWLSGL